MKNQILKIVFILVAFAMLFTGTAGAKDLEFVCLSKGPHPWFDDAWQGFSDAAKEIGGINARFVIPSEFSVEVQIQYLENVVAEGVDGIAMASLDPGGLEAPINAAMERGVPIVIWDDDVPKSKRIVFCGTANYDAGVAQAKAVMDQMDSANYVIWIQDRSASTVKARIKGIRDALKDNPNFVEIAGEEQYVGYDLSEGVAAVENVLQTYPDINCAFDVGMNGAIGLARVMKDRGMGLDKINNTAWTVLPDITKGIKENLIGISMRQNPYAMGYLNCYALKWYIDGLRPTKDFFDTGIIAVTAENVETAEKENRAKVPAMLKEFRKQWK